MGSSNSLGLIPRKSIVLQQCHCNLSMFDIIDKPNKVKVRVQLMDEASNTHAIHSALKIIGQPRLYSRRQTWRCRLSLSMLIGLPFSIEISLQLGYLSLEVGNYLRNVNWLLLHGCIIRQRQKGGTAGTQPTHKGIKATTGPS